MKLYIHGLTRSQIHVNVIEDELIDVLIHKIEDLTCVPAENQLLHYQGKILSSGQKLSDFDVIDESNIHLTLRLLGGKGGFGAMLRAKAKQKKKTTTDFGMCRDLSGRRLKHINNEIIIRKFNDAKENGEELDMNEETPTGIENWHLPKPTWADGVKGSSQKKFLKKREKTEMCADWERTRENGEPPVNAPIWWGCPRGSKCGFAHGLDELRGERHTEIVNSQREEKLAEQRKLKEEYMGNIELESDDDEDLQQSVLMGLKQASQQLQSNANTVRANDGSSNEEKCDHTEIVKSYDVSEPESESDSESKGDDLLPLDDYGF